MHKSQTSLFCQGNTTLPTLAFLLVPHLSSPSEEGATIFKSGAAQTSGNLFLFDNDHILILSLCRPQNSKELFNLRHASLRNVIERIFGVIKRCFRLLVHPPEFAMDIQARLPPALAALHNFIRKHDPDDLADYEDAEDPDPGARAVGPVAEGELARGLPRVGEREQVNLRRDRIAQDMWAQYQELLRRRSQV
jgi:hypothetical protein